jgi:hypothetical protein
MHFVIVGGQTMGRRCAKLDLSILENFKTKTLFNVKY